MAGIVPVLTWELGYMREARKSQHRAGERVGRATSMPTLFPGGCPLVCGTGEPEFQVLLRISLFDLLRSGKEDLDGISLH